MADLVVAAAACWLLGLLSISAIFCHCEKGAETLNEGGNVDIVFHSLVFQYGLHQHLHLTVLQGRSGVVKLMDGLVRHEDDLDPVVDNPAVPLEVCVPTLKKSSRAARR